MITLKTECGVKEDLHIDKDLWDRSDSESKSNLMLQFLQDNFSVYAYHGDEYTGDCL